MAWQEITPRIVKIGDNLGCPCGGTHVSDISEIVRIKVSRNLSACFLRPTRCDLRFSIFICRKCFLCYNSVEEMWWCFFQLCLLRLILIFFFVLTYASVKPPFLQSLKSQFFVHFFSIIWMYLWGIRKETFVLKGHNFCRVIFGCTLLYYVLWAV